MNVCVDGTLSWPYSHLKSSDPNIDHCDPCQDKVVSGEEPYSKKSQSDLNQSFNGGAVSKPVTKIPRMQGGREGQPIETSYTVEDFISEEQNFSSVLWGDNKTLRSADVVS